nr:hypothetical protein GCM10020185_78680 [Pseudomonas brassicacearum subsp. brassicacearum]
MPKNIARGDENYLALLDAADAYIARNGLDLPLEPQARDQLPDPQCLTQPILELDLVAAGVASVIWATGYSVDYSWLKVDALGANGKPRHQRGVSSEPGLYFVGLPWLSRRGSAFIWGVWHDARHIADHIVKQRIYLAYQDAAQRQAPARDSDSYRSKKPVSRESVDAYSYTYSHVQHQGHLPEPDAGQRPVPGRARRQHRLCARPGWH